MSNRNLAEELATRLEEANEAVLTVARNCSQAQWETVVPDEQRTVGVLFHHLAWLTPFIMKYAITAAAGNELPISPSASDRGRQLNANHAQEYAQVPQAEVIRLLQATCEAAIPQLRKLTDEQLNITTPWRQPYEPVPEQDVASAKLLIEWNLIYHRYDHLSQIKKVLGIK